MPEDPAGPAGVPNGPGPALPPPPGHCNPTPEPCNPTRPESCTPPAPPAAPRTPTRTIPPSPPPCCPSPGPPHTPRIARTSEPPSSPSRIRQAPLPAPLPPSRSPPPSPTGRPDPHRSPAPPPEPAGHRPAAPRSARRRRRAPLPGLSSFAAPSLPLPTESRLIDQARHGALPLGTGGWTHGLPPVGNGKPATRRRHSRAPPHRHRGSPGLLTASTAPSDAQGPRGSRQAAGRGDPRQPSLRSTPRPPSSAPGGGRQSTRSPSEDATLAVWRGTPVDARVGHGARGTPPVGLVPIEQGCGRWLTTPAEVGVDQLAGGSSGQFVQLVDGPGLPAPGPADPAPAHSSAGGPPNRFPAATTRARPGKTPSLGAADLDASVLATTPSAASASSPTRSPSTPTRRACQ